MKMSETVKKVNNVAFKVGKNLDWDGMTKLLVLDEARKEFSNLCRAFDEVNSQLQTMFSYVPSFLSTNLYLSFLYIWFTMWISLSVVHRC